MNKQTNIFVGYDDTLSYTHTHPNNTGARWEGIPKMLRYSASDTK